MTALQDPGNATSERSTISALGAQAVVQAVETKAVDMGVPVVVAVVDDGGALKAFLRMDGTPLGAVQWAIDKALTAASFRTPTHILDQAMTGAAASALASFMIQPHATLAPGGYPLVVDGTVIGGIGASGGSPEQDQIMAEAGVAAL